MKIWVLRAEILAKTRLKMQNFLKIENGGYIGGKLVG